MKGTAIFGGYAVGNALLILPRKNAKADRKPLSKEEEQARLKAAIGEFIKKTQAQAEYVKKSVGEKEADILLGHIAMINDPYMTDEMLSGISGGLSAEEALKNVCDMFISVFSSAEDEFTRERAADIRDVKAGVLEGAYSKRRKPRFKRKKGQRSCNRRIYPLGCRSNKPRKRMRRHSADGLRNLSRRNSRKGDENPLGVRSKGRAYKYQGTAKSSP